MKGLSSRISRLEQTNKSNEMVTTWADLLANATNEKDISLSAQLTELLNRLEE